MEESEKHFLRFNFIMGLLHGMFYNGGIAFVNSTTVLPIFLSNLTQSKVLIGLSSSIMGELGGIGAVLPQLFTANKIEHKIYKRPLLRLVISVRALCWGILALITYLFASSYPNITVLGLFLLLSLFTFMGGIAVIPFMDIWGKTIPANLRGRFFGYRQLFGGLLAIVSGIIVKFILYNDKIIFPDNYTLLFLFTFIFISVSYFALGSVKEPSAEVHKNLLSFYDFLKKALRILKRDVNYRKFLFVQILSGAIALSLPFYVLYARNVLKIRLDMVGVFLSAQMVGMLFSNIIWAHLADFLGVRRVIQVSIFLSLLVPLTVFLVPKRFPGLFVIGFVLIGSFIASRKIGKNKFLLDAASAKDRPTYISLEGTARLPVMLLPLIGGAIVQYISYKILFELTIVVLAIAFILSFQLKEPAYQMR